MGDEDDSRGILDNFVAKHTRVFNAREHKAATRLLAIEFQSSLPSTLTRIEHIVAQITKAHHLWYFFRETERPNKTVIEK